MSNYHKMREKLNFNLAVMLSHVETVLKNNMQKQYDIFLVYPVKRKRFLELLKMELHTKYV